MYQAQPVAAADGKCCGQLGRAVAEPAGGDHHRAGGDRVVADRHTDDRAVLVIRRSTRWPRATSISASGTPGEHVDHGLAAADRHVDARHPLLAAEHQRVVELDAEIAEPLDGRAGELGEPCGDAGLDVPAVERHVVVEQRVRRRR